MFITLDTSQKDESKVNSVNPLYLLVQIIDDFIEEKEGSKYLNIAFTDSNCEVLKNMKKIGEKLKIVLKKQMIANQENMEKITWK